ncbi:MAG TPA: polymer-forming cytoskeletal protein [Abditibacteriaceae bacterium]|jgi:hypothetical protein
MNTLPTTTFPTWLGVIGLFLLFGVWVMLPLIPALTEMRRRTDALPLRIVREYDGNVRFFAQGFLGFLNKEWKDALSMVANTQTDRQGHLSDGSPFLITTGRGMLPLDQKESRKRTVDKVIACSGTVTLPDELYFAREILALKPLIGGDHNIYRAIRGESAVSLGRDSVILRWLHAQGPIETGPDNHLYGRASSEERIRIAEGAIFQRLHAPLLEFGTTVVAPVSDFSTVSLKRVEKLPGEYDKIAQRHLATGNLNIDAKTHYVGNVVSLKSLTVGDGSFIEGNLKSRDTLRIQRGTRIDGAITSGGDLIIESGCFIKGPIVAEGRMTISNGVQIGSPLLPTTASGPRIEIAPGVTAYGTVWARDEGRVSSPQSRA